jgi:hypothetical protein
MACVVGLIGLVHHVSIPLGVRPLKEQGNILMQRSLIACEGQHRVRFLLDNRLANLFLGPHGVNRDDAAGQL